MANSTSASLDLLRRNILSIIISNTSVKFVGINKSLENYITNGDSSFSSFMHLMDFNPDILSSSQVSASLLLSYMDFYSVYALMYANYIPVFQNLKNVSESKYAHIYNLYKELNALVKEKQHAQSNFFVLYSNFLYPNNIDLLNSGLVNRNGHISKPLDIGTALTLPVSSKKDIKPSSISFFSNDGSISTNESEIGLDYFRFEILRKQNNKIGTVKSGGIKPASDSTIASPDVTGTIFGYFASSIYLEITNITKDSNDDIVSVEVIGSANGFDWSDPYTVDIDIISNIIIEDNIELGLEVRFYSGIQIKTGDRWKIEINNLNISYPKLDISLNFDILEPVSMLRYMDISSYPLFIESSKIDRNRFSSEKFIPRVFNGRIGHVAVSEGSLNQYRTELGQKDYEIHTKDGELYYKYDFKLSDIKASICKYERHGSILFEPVDVQNINTVSVEATTHLPEYEVTDITYDETDEDQATKVRVPKVNLEFNVLIETEAGRTIIPMLQSDTLFNKSIFEDAGNTLVSVGAIVNPVKGDAAVIDDADDPGNGGTYIYSGASWVKVSDNDTEFKHILFEHVMPDSVNHNESFGDITYAPALYTPRFTVDETYDIKGGASILTYNSELLVEAGSTWAIATKKLTINEYFMKDAHSVYYAPLIYGVTDVSDIVPASKWTHAASDIYYIYYADEDRKIHLAIRQLNSEGNLMPFSGKIQGHIEMSSIDDLYKTPMIFDYTLGMI